MPFMTPVVASLIIIGGLGGVSTWIVGPTKGIMVASEDGSLPLFLTKKNRHGVPTNALILQAVIVTALMLVFILMPTINSSFWLLSAITAELALVVYITLFISGLVLHYKMPQIKRSFKVPGGSWGIWITCLLGCSVSFFAIIVGFIPPKKLVGDHLLLYEMVLILGMIFLSILPLILTRIINKKSI
jgi:amino acid transporter